MLETFVVDKTCSCVDEALGYFNSILKNCSENLIVQHAIVTSQQPWQDKEYIQKRQTIVTFSDPKHAKSCVEKNWNKSFIIQHAPQIKSQDPILSVDAGNATLIYPIDDSLDQLERYVLTWKEELSQLTDQSEKKFIQLVQKWISSMDGHHMTALSMPHCDFTLTDMKVGRHRMIKDWLVTSQVPVLFTVWRAIANRLLESQSTILISDQKLENTDDASHIDYRTTLFQIPMGTLIDQQNNQWSDLDCMAEGTLKNHAEIEFMLIMRRNEHGDYEYRLILTTEDESMNLDQVQMTLT